MIDDDITEDEKGELSEVIRAVGDTLQKLRSQLAHALRCDEMDLTVEARWDVIGVNSWAEYGMPSHCGTTLRHGSIAVMHHNPGDIAANKMTPREDDTYPLVDDPEYTWET
jgi:hypothetical protein